jgi:hypothetical protein
MIGKDVLHGGGELRSDFLESVKVACGRAGGIHGAREAVCPWVESDCFLI